MDFAWTKSDAKLFCQQKVLLNISGPGRILNINGKRKRGYCYMLQLSNSTLILFLGLLEFICGGFGKIWKRLMEAEQNFPPFIIYHVHIHMSSFPFSVLFLLLFSWIGSGRLVICIYIFPPFNLSFKDKFFMALSLISSSSFNRDED